MRIFISLFIMALPILGFSQKKVLKGKFCELSEPTKIEYKFKGNSFEYFAKADVVNFYGKGRYELKGDSIALYFDEFANQSGVEYTGQANADKESEFQITVIDANGKMGLAGAKVQFYLADVSLINENHLNENGELNFKSSKPIEFVLISYIGQSDLKLKIDKSNNIHQFKVLWKTSENTIISGEIWKYEIRDIKKSSFKLKKEGEYFSYKKKCF